MANGNGSRVPPISKETTVTIGILLVLGAAIWFAATQTARLDHQEEDLKELRQDRLQLHDDLVKYRAQVDQYREDHYERGNELQNIRERVGVLEALEEKR